MTMRKTFSICGMCTVRCPIQAYSDDSGRVARLRGNPFAGGINGAMCPRGAAGIALLEDDERPQFPMIRTGERGEGKWRRATWDEALDYVAGKLKAVISEHGPKAVMLSDRGGPFVDLHRAFIKGLGSPNVLSHDPSCASNVNHAAWTLFNFGRASLVYDLRNAKHVVLQTRNIFEAVNVKEVNNLLDAMDDGCRLTVLDIRATVSASKADTFLMLRPGTDYAFNLAVIHELIAAKLYDAAYVQRAVAGFDWLTGFVAPYTPEWAEAQTGVPASSIRKLARELAEAAPAVIWHPGWMTARYKDSFYVSRTAYIINALLGAYGAKGGLPSGNKASDVGRKGLKQFSALFPKPEAPRVDGAGSEYPHISSGGGLIHKGFEAVESGEPYPMRAYFAWRHDPLGAFPDPEELKRRLAKLDLLVSTTFTWSNTAWYSDVVLPLSLYLERESPLGGGSGLIPQFSIRNRVCEPRFDTRSEWEIISGLSQRMGLDKLAFKSAQEMWAYQLEGTEVELADFEAKGFVSLAAKPLYREPAFATASGKIEIVSEVMERTGLPSLAPYEPAPAPPEGGFRLTYGRVALHTQGHTVNNPYLFEQMPENLLWLNSERAQELGLANGDRVEVRPCSNPEAKPELIKIKVTKFIHPEAVFMLHGFGHTLPVESRARGKGASDVNLMPGGLDNWSKEGGGINMQENFVSLRKA